MASFKTKILDNYLKFSLEAMPTGDMDAPNRYFFRTPPTRLGLAPGAR